MRGFKGVLEQRPTVEHNTNNMKTEKTKGDILAERIEEIIDNPNAEPFHSRMRKALDDYRAPESVLTPAQIADGWIEWNGGECPAWGWSTLTVMFRDLETQIRTAANCDWSHRKSTELDIIAYRPDPYEALKKAHSEGKVIQWFTNGKWITLEMGAKDPLFLVHSPEYYRVKPAPVMLPLGPEDVPPGSVIRSARESTRKPWIAVLNVLSVGVEILGNTGTGYTVPFTVLFADEWQISRDGGKTWQKCEKPEEAK